jgi:site-specific DNA-cytosine methylase
MEEGSLDRAPIWSDLKTFDPSPWSGKVDLITGGYPCQPFSHAGRRAGKEDPRHLWPYIRAIVESTRPAFCFFENVDGHLTIGYREVRQDLEDMGYETQEGIFSAEEVGDSQLRKRLFVLARRRGARLPLSQPSILRGEGRRQEGRAVEQLREPLADADVGRREGPWEQDESQQQCPRRDIADGCRPADVVDVDPQRPPVERDRGAVGHAACDDERRDRESDARSEGSIGGPSDAVADAPSVVRFSRRTEPAGQCGVPSATVEGGAVVHAEHADGRTVGLESQTRHWPTPSASLMNDAESPESFEARQAKWSGTYHNSTPLTVARKTWSTPRSSPNENRGSGHAPSHGVTHGRTLAGDATTFAVWPTPRAVTGGAESGARKKELGRTKSGGGDLQADTHAFSLPNQTTTTPGSTSLPREEILPLLSLIWESAERRKLLRLNPNFVEWLMGWPPNWSKLTPIEPSDYSYWETASCHLLQDLLSVYWQRS